MGENRGFTVIFIIVIIALVVGLFGIGSTAINLINSGQPILSGTVSTKAEAPQTTAAAITVTPVSTATDASINYNFGAGTTSPFSQLDFSKVAQTARTVKSADAQAAATPTPAPTVSTNPTDMPGTPVVSEGIKDDILTPAVVAQAATVPVEPAALQAEEVNWIKIDSIGIDSPIVEGSDGDKALDQGMWLYPSSYNKNEKILLCHRRYWGRKDPRTCWFIDRVKMGDLVRVSDGKGNEYDYRIVSQTVHDADDLSIYRASNDDVIKILTCTPLGSSAQRLVTIAVRV